MNSGLQKVIQSEGKVNNMWIHSFDVDACRIFLNAYISLSYKRNNKGDSFEESMLLMMRRQLRKL